VSGPAGALLLYTWRRPIGSAVVETRGDAGVLKVFRTAKVIP
jgi:hypothetical protein